MSRVYITIVVKDKKYVFEALEISKTKRQPQLQPLLNIFLNNSLYLLANQFVIQSKDILHNLNNKANTHNYIHY